MNAFAIDSFAGLVSHALERMAFVITEPTTDAPAEALAESVAQATIVLRGLGQHSLTVAATAGLVREFASGMLGVDVDEVDVAEHAQSAVGELANVLAGELVMLATAGDAPASLGIPSPTSAAEAAKLLAVAESTGFCVVLRSDVGKLLVMVS
jgi:CheY-specific phosphatase CheX